MKIILISGFKSSEMKNTLFAIGNELIAKDRKVCAVVIEGSKDNIKKVVIPDSSLMLRKMKDVPCTFVTDLTPELQQINKESSFDYIIVEVPFGLPPGKVKKALLNHIFKNISFAPIIYVFDLEMLKNDVKIIPKIVSTQIKESEVVFVNSGSIDKNTAEALRGIFEEINPGAHIFEVAADSGSHRISDFVDRFQL